MARSLEEQETIYRWDRQERMLWGWTANRSERARWHALGYPVTQEGAGWRTRVPMEALALLPLKGGVVQVSRYLAPPVVIAPPVGDRSTDTRNSEQNRSSFATAPQTAKTEGSSQAAGDAA